MLDLRFGGTGGTLGVTGGRGACSGERLGNPGFETGTPAPWTATRGVISNTNTGPPHGGSWDAQLVGYGTTHTDRISQAVSIPAGCHATLSFWLHVDSSRSGLRRPTTDSP